MLPSKLYLYLNFEMALIPIFKRGCLAVTIQNNPSQQPEYVDQNSAVLLCRVMYIFVKIV